VITTVKLFNPPINVSWTIQLSWNG